MLSTYIASFASVFIAGDFVFVKVLDNVQLENVFLEVQIMLVRIAETVQYRPDNRD